MKLLLDQIRKMAEYNSHEASFMADRSVGAYGFGYTTTPTAGFVSGAHWQNSKDQALILKLIEIIELQSTALEHFDCSHIIVREPYDSGTLEYEYYPAAEALQLTEANLKSLLEVI